MSEKALRFGIVGCGRVVQDLHLPTWKLIPQAQLAAICDANPTIIEQLSVNYPGVRRYTQFELFLSEAHDLDFVVLATPGSSHPVLGEQLLRSGLHLLCEKPLSLQSSAATHLYAIAEANHRLLIPIHNYRYRENTQEALHALNNHTLGETVNAQVRFRSGSLFKEASPWMHQERKHRILLFDFAYHFIDIALLFLGPVAELCFVDAEEDTLGLQYVVFGTRHQNGARGLFELQLDASSQSTTIDILGEQAGVQLEFFPDGIRKLQGRDSPLHQQIAQSKRLVQFAKQTVAHRFFKAPSHRILPHMRLFKAFVEQLQSGDRDQVTKTPIVPKVEVLELISLLEHVAERAYSKERAL